MFNFSPSSSAARFYSAICPAKDTQLANRIKKGQATPAEINALFSSSEDSNRFFNDPAVQRKVLKGWLDGQNYDSRIINALETCVPGINQTDQVKIIEKRGSAIRGLASEHAKMALITRFLTHLPSDFTPPPAPPTDASDPATVPIETILTVAEQISDDNLEAPLLREDFVPFEAIAQSIAGTVQVLTSVWDAFEPFFNQGNSVSNEGLAAAITYNNCSYAEEQKLENILSSAENGAQFFSDPEVQMILLQGWLDGADIDARILDAMQACVPNLHLADQERLANQLLELFENPSTAFKKETMLARFLTNIAPTTQLDINFAFLASMNRAKYARSISAIELG